MVRVVKYLSVGVVVIIACAVVYGAKGYFDAMLEADDLRARADVLIEQGHGGDNLGDGRRASVLMIQDPAFATHSGMDFTTPGAGITTISQSVSKRLAFDQFRPGIGKIRQTGFALGLERQLDKDQILALWLDTVEMGHGPDGWMTGFFTASDAIYDRAPSVITGEEFLRLVAVLIAPGSFDLRGTDPELDGRVQRIMRRVGGHCAPIDHEDVWLDGC